MNIIRALINVSIRKAAKHKTASFDSRFVIAKTKLSQNSKIMPESKAKKAARIKITTSRYDTLQAVELPASLSQPFL